MDPRSPDQPPALAPLETWLEPGYADGRIGAWLRDVPGVFASASTTERAISALLTSTGRVREWLEGHGDELGLGALGRVEVVGEVATGVASDGYEVNATFPWDRRPFAPDEADVVARRLRWLLDDLRAVLSGVDRFEASHGRLRSGTTPGEWTVDEELHHLGSATAWFAGRLDGGVYGGPLDGADVRGELGGASAWALDRLQALAAADSGLR